MEDQENQAKFFGPLYLYITPFLKQLWNKPKLIAKILSLAEYKDLENNLAHFVTHNLYENLFSSNGKEEQLLYIITLLLKEEIDNFQSKESNSFEFLVDTPCSSIFKELISKKEVQSFFKTILIDISKKIEMTNSLDKLSFEPDEINELLIMEEF